MILNGNNVEMDINKFIIVNIKLYFSIEVMFYKMRDSKGFIYFKIINKKIKKYIY